MRALSRKPWARAHMIQFRRSRPVVMLRAYKYGAPARRDASLGPSLVISGVWNCRATQSDPVWKYSTPMTANTLSSSTSLRHAAFCAFASTTLYVAKYSCTLRPAKGSTCRFCQPFTSARHWFATFPLLYAGPSALSAERSGYATPSLIVVDVTPRAGPDEAAAADDPF